MSAVAIDRFKVCYRTPLGDVRAQPRLQRIVLNAVEHMLEGALDRAGVGRDELVCIRNLRSVVRLRLRDSDSMLTAACGEALARDIAAAARRNSTSIVIYPSRAHAVVDLASAAASGDAGRSWAWSQVGIWHDSRPVSADAMVRATMRALIDEPRNAVAVLSYLARARRNAFDALMDRGAPNAWIEIARAAGASAGAPAGWLEKRPVSDERGLQAEVEWADPGTSGERGRLVGARYLRASAIAEAALGRIAADGEAQRETISTADAPRLTAVAALAILEVEPACVSTSADRLRQTLTVAERELRARASSSVIRSVDVAAVDRRPIVDAQERQAGRVAAETRASSRVIRSVDVAAVDRRPIGDAQERQARRVAAETPDFASRLEAIRPPDASSEPVVDTTEDLRRRGSTRFGGVLFLVNVAEAIGLPACLLNDHRLVERGLRWTLHRVAVLLGGDPGDAAVLAFAGLPPDEPPPSAGQPPPDAAELHALHEHRRTLLHAVGERLGLSDEPDDDLIRFVCARRASIVADPGWIEMRLPADEVSIEIRRCGLDHDPGWVPWLGVVVRFRYV